MNTVKLTIEYDGTDFAGWQIQPRQRTIQGEIEKALKKLTGNNTRITGAGRTDAGVHAKGQVASFHVENPLPVKAYKEGLNSVAPDDIRIRSAEVLDRPFNARFDAKSRSYRYVFTLSPDVFNRKYAWFPGSAVDFERMERLSKLLLGEHDFASFCKLEPGEDDAKSIIYNISWTRMEDTVWFEITGIRFLRHMVRIIIGTLHEAGIGKLDERTLLQILEMRDRSKAGPTAPPHGLCLLSVTY